MKVKRLKISSFRGIGDLTLDFSPDEPTVFSKQPLPKVVNYEQYLIP